MGMVGTRCAAYAARAILRICETRANVPFPPIPATSGVSAFIPLRTLAAERFRAKDRHVPLRIMRARYTASHR
jgi:hypothetical protein